MYSGILEALWFILPAYMANSTPVNVSKLRFLETYGKPLDGGMYWRGIRILGDGKTWRGLVSGIFIGTFSGILQSYFHADSQVFLQSLRPDDLLLLPVMTPVLAFMLSFGALAGDLVASFIKRRIGLKSGDPAPLMDQLDFVFGAIFFSWLLIGSIDYNRFFIIVFITPAIHVLGNFIACAWKLKKKPW